MAIEDSALSEVLSAIKVGEGTNLVRDIVEWGMQALMLSVIQPAHGGDIVIAHGCVTQSPPVSKLSSVDGHGVVNRQ